jgi:superfamily I DNA and RNA helicase
MVMETQFMALTPYENFVFALKAKESKRQYPNRLNKFFTFIGLQGTIEESSVQLFELSKNDLNLLQSYLIRFINSQKERIENKEICRRNTSQLH